ncbi:class I SAM-dependent methyltransferase [Mumia sp. ZJ430]|uniref:class I SAM-dependent methyltransferase n=1 Tax=Mumia sp. ZJ430 TaxID=2708083 RepID=UPI001423023B|nr:class I SAM-dependent methyltransferase [Mumia sp. ZJ430]
MKQSEIAKLASIEDKHWWFRERRALIASFIADVPPGRALDIGAAAGGNTRTLEAAGWKSTALEYDESAVELARARGLDVVQGDARDLPFDEDEFDAVVAYDVLEHIVEDDAVVSEIARVVRPGGKVYIAVPADPKLWSAHDDAVGHVRRYTRDSLVALFERPEFTLDLVKSWNVLLRPAIRLARRDSEGSDIEPMAAPINAALSGIIKLERHLPVGRRKGVSLLLNATVR